MSKHESKTCPGQGPAAPPPVELPPTRVGDLDGSLRPKKAARRALKVPMKAVEVLLPAAAVYWQDHVEYVHQLRVSTRRASAAIDVFGACLEPRRARRTQKLLKRIRRAAGEARDCDVHLGLFRALQQECEASLRPAVAHLIDGLELRRVEAQEEVIHAAARYPASRLRQARQSLREATSPPGRLRMPGPEGEKGRRRAVRRLRDLAAVVVPPAALAVRREARGESWDEAQLHEVRIALKRLRYACEIFYGCMTEERQAAIKGQVIPLVDRLGAMNDVSNVLCRVHEFEAEVGDDEQELRASFAALAGYFEKQRAEAQAAAASALREVLDHHVFEMLEDGRGLSAPAGSPSAAGGPSPSPPDQS
ncbi:MAG: CHAD domain-containing protein [Phycisphaerales bacterium]|nr:CHAD domain-containing protein [Phycisphaerales bacterium]